MNRLFLIVVFVFCTSIANGQCSNDFYIKNENNGQTFCFPNGIGQYTIDVCPTRTSRYQLNSNVNNTLTVTPSSGGNSTVSPNGRYSFPPISFGTYTIQNTVTLTKTIINFVPTRTASVTSINFGVDTLKYCRNHGNFTPNFNFITDQGTCYGSYYNVQNSVSSIKINNVLRQIKNFVRGSSLVLDSLNNGDKIQLMFNGNVTDPYMPCPICLDFANNIETKPVILKILENNTLPTPILTGSPICAGDTAIVTRSQSLKKVRWGDLNQTDSSISRKILNPAQVYLQSINTLANGCYGTSPDVIISNKNCGYKMVRGYVYEDLNGNYSFDPKIDRIFPNVKVILTTKAGTFIGIAFSNSNGVYELKSNNYNDGYNYVTISDVDFYPNSNSIWFITSQVQYTETSISTFKLLSSDLNLLATSGRSRPGFTIPLYFNINNQGKKTNGGVLTVSLDNAYTYSSASKAAKSINGKTLTFDVDSIESGRTQTITVYAILSTTSTLGSTISSSASLATTKPDDNTA
ncbi:MAG: hypothetical protein H7329_01485, partial [Opitutaceae bacterium]|nr:hypothetical protein [Cytophagales bacterium]